MERKNSVTMYMHLDSVLEKPTQSALTTGIVLFAVWAKRTAKALEDMTKSLPCVAAWQHAHGNVLPGNGFFAVRFIKTARQRLCRAR
jgi:hypothetical protein